MSVMDDVSDELIFTIFNHIPVIPVMFGIEERIHV